jgi:hypothetical protein
MTQTEKILRTVACLLLLTVAVATIIRWDVVAVAALSLGGPLAIVSILWEEIRTHRAARARERQAETKINEWDAKFKRDVDEFLEHLFGDQRP